MTTLNYKELKKQFINKQREQDKQKTYSTVLKAIKIIRDIKRTNIIKGVK